MTSVAQGSPTAAILAILLSFAAAVPAPAQSEPAKAPDAPAPAAEAPAPKDGISLKIGESRSVDLQGRVERVVVVDSRVADAEPVAPNRVVIVGRGPGTTEVHMQVEGGTLVTQRVHVSADLEELTRRLRAIADAELEVSDVGGTIVIRGAVSGSTVTELLDKFMESTGLRWLNTTYVPEEESEPEPEVDYQAQLKAIFGIDFEVEVVGGTIAVRGVVPDDATKEAVSAYMSEAVSSWVDLTSVRAPTSDLKSKLRTLVGADIEVVDLGSSVAISGSLPDVATAEALKRLMDSSGIAWADGTRIAGVQQVQLRVRIAEASRAALRELAFGAVAGGDVFGGVQAPGGSPFQPVSISPLAGSAVTSANFAFDSSPVTTATTLFGGVTGSNLEIFLRALTENRYIRLLAEPNLVAVSGEEATFLVGGEFPIPIVQGSVVGGGSTITIEYKEFGVRLNFRPNVLGDGRIRLEVTPEVSELSQIGALNQNGFTVPALVTRKSSTTVELGSGQSFAMAGLLRANDQAQVSKVPVLGDIPGLGVLFRSVRYEQQQTELVVMVTAELVEPLDQGDARPGPGDLHDVPNDWELFVEGRMNGAIKVGNPVARLKDLGLGNIRGPGAWRRPDEPRKAAADRFTPVASAPAAATAPAASDAPSSVEPVAVPPGDPAVPEPQPALQDPPPAP